MATADARQSYLLAFRASRARCIASVAARRIEGPRAPCTKYG
jgi:hypothetical protein